MGLLDLFRTKQKPAAPYKDVVGQREAPGELAGQRYIAESPEWHLAKLDSERQDTRNRLIALGFTIQAEDDSLFFKVTPPLGWTKATEGYHTTVRDKEGKERISQFFKAASYDTRAEILRIF